MKNAILTALMLTAALPLHAADEAPATPSNTPQEAAAQGCAVLCKGFGMGDDPRGWGETVEQARTIGELADKLGLSGDAANVFVSHWVELYRDGCACKLNVYCPVHRAMELQPGDIVYTTKAWEMIRRCPGEANGHKDCTLPELKPYF